VTPGKPGRRAPGPASDPRSRPVASPNATWQSLPAATGATARRRTASVVSAMSPPWCPRPPPGSRSGRAVPAHVPRHDRRIPADQNADFLIQQAFRESAGDLFAFRQRQHHAHGGHPVPPNHQDQMLRPPESAPAWRRNPTSAPSRRPRTCLLGRQRKRRAPRLREGTPKRTMSIDTARDSSVVLVVLGHQVMRRRICYTADSAHRISRRTPTTRAVRGQRA
jgi:hypothetical protein